MKKNSKNTFLNVAFPILRDRKSNTLSDDQIRGFLSWWTRETTKLFDQTKLPRNEDEERVLKPFKINHYYIDIADKGKAQLLFETSDNSLFVDLRRRFFYSVLQALVVKAVPKDLLEIEIHNLASR